MMMMMMMAGLSDRLNVCSVRPVIQGVYSPYPIILQQILTKRSTVTRDWSQSIVIPEFLILEQPPYEYETQTNAVYE